MSRFLPLVILVIWLSSPSLPALGGIAPLVGCAIFLGFYLLMIGVLAVWSRRGGGVVGVAHLSHIQRRIRRFHSVIYASRILIPVWLAAGIFVLGWRESVLSLLAHTPIGRLPIDFPGLLIGCLPPFAAWMGLWWAQFPADRA